MGVRRVGRNLLRPRLVRSAGFINEEPPRDDRPHWLIVIGPMHGRTICATTTDTLDPTGELEGSTFAANSALLVGHGQRRTRIPAVKRPILRVHRRNKFFAAWRIGVVVCVCGHVRNIHICERVCVCPVVCDAPRPNSRIDADCRVVVTFGFVCSMLFFLVHCGRFLVCRWECVTYVCVCVFCMCDRIIMHAHRAVIVMCLVC